MRRSTDSSPAKRSRKRQAPFKDSHQNPAFYVRREGSHYEPLDATQDEIRLLRVKPAAKSTEPVTCELFHSRLSSAPPYCALSYAWGARARLVSIQVDGSPADVTPNLKHALQRLRPPEGQKDVILWVDALCINQSDIPERNLQTGKMRMIYSHAKSVSVWLGMRSSRSDQAMQLARDLNHCPREKIPSMIRDAKKAESFDALVTLFRRQYWWRIWVVQEVSCARECTIYCGKEAISWAELEAVCDILRDYGDALQDIYYSRPSYPRTLTHGGPKSLLLPSVSTKDQRPSLFELAATHKSKKSTDPKDKVYALVGISSSRDTFGDIDYSQSMREVYSHAARHMISTSKELDVICIKQHNLEQFDLPTWVPDWTRPPHSSGPTLVGLRHHEPPFSAAGGSIAETSFLEDGYVLKTSALVVGHIKHLAVPLKKNGPPGDVTSVLDAFNNWWETFVSSRGDSRESRISFAKCISCENWTTDDENSEYEKLQAIFDFTSSGRASKYTFQPEPEPGEEDTRSARPATPVDEKAQVATILSASLTMNRRTLFISDDIVGLAPWDAKPEDIVCVLPGCRFPVVLRKLKTHVILIGEAYVGGYMHGKAMDELTAGKLRMETFEIH